MKDWRYPDSLEAANKSLEECLILTPLCSFCNSDCFPMFLGTLKRALAGGGACYLQDLHGEGAAEWGGEGLPV